MPLKVYQISDFRGGEAEEAKMGLRGSFKSSKNLNIHRKGENNLSCNQKLKKISPDTGDHKVTELIIKFVRVSATKVYGFGNAGGVYLINGETVTKKYTDPDGEILDAEFFYDYLYWTTKTHLKRHLEATADWTDGNSGALTPDSGTFNECDYHPLYHVPKSDLLTVGNKRFVSTISAANYFNAEALDLHWGWTVKCLNLKKPLLLIGATKWGRAELFTWDLTSESYDPLEGWIEKDINAFLETTDGARYIFSPEMLYWFKQGLAIKVRELPSQVKSGAIDLHRGRIHFGTTKGVYSWASVSKNYPDVLNLEYTISTGSDEDIEIGAILGKGDDLLVGWFDDSQVAGSKYGIDITDQDNKADAVYESLLFDSKTPYMDKLYSIIQILTKPLPEDCSVKIYYKGDQKGDWVLASRQDIDAVTEERKESFAEEGEVQSIHATECQCRIYQVKIELFPNVNDTPEIEDILSYFEDLTIH